MTMAPLIRKAFNWGGSITIAEVQSIVSVAGSVALSMTARAGRHRMYEDNALATSRLAGNRKLGVSIGWYSKHRKPHSPPPQ